MQDITYTVPIKVEGKSTLKQILKGVTGSMRSGSLNAVMGPSGGGKVRACLLSSQWAVKHCTGLFSSQWAVQHCTGPLTQCW